MSFADSKSYLHDKNTSFTNTDSRDNNFQVRLNRSLENLHSPSQPIQLKMPKRRLRK